ncbi:MAG TPA: hypothetical protein PK156_16255, partial [Polyangium sp.]|nr:hypothetical protein [Polyangium sp.]
EPAVPRIAPPAPPVPARQTPSAPVKPPPPVPQMLRPNEVAPASLAAASHRAAGNEPGPAAFGPPPTPPIAPPMSRPVPPIAPPMNLPSAAGLAPPPPARTRAPTLAGITPPNPVNVPPGPTGTTFGQAAVLAAAKSQIPPVSSPPPDRESVRPSKPDSRSLASAAFVGAAEASTAAAAMTPNEKEDKPVGERSSASSSGPAPYRALVDLLWFASGLPPRLEENAAWKRILEVEAPPEEKPAVDEDGFLAVDLNRPQKRPATPPPEKTPEQKAKEDKSRVSRVISRATATNDVEQALYLALNDDGVLEPPLCLVAGEFELPFDEVETLKVLTSAATPLATADKKLKETIDLANEAMGTPLGQSPEVAANFSLRIREAWTKANRFLPPDYLDVHSRRVLLEQRKYQKRELTGEQWIRGVVFGVSGDKPIPAYLPADAGKSLPLFQKFPARLIVEVLPPQDQYEVHPIALRVHVLARTITTRPRR